MQAHLTIGIRNHVLIDCLALPMEIVPLIPFSLYLHKLPSR
jgi:hypothetical protein